MSEVGQSSNVSSAVSNQDFKSFLKAQLLYQGNQTCFDCNKPSTTSVHLQFGVYLCTNCCLIHTANLNTATHIAKSFENSSWLEEDMLSLQFGGNARGREYFERSGEAHQAKDEFQIRQKYSSQAAQNYKKMLAVDIQLGMERGTVLEVVQEIPENELATSNVAKLITNPKYQDNDMEGWLSLFQKAGTWRRMQWLLRYFVLKGGQLHCFKTLKDKKPLLSMATARFSVGAMRNTTQANAFELAPIAGKEPGLLLSASSQAEMQLWIARLIQKGTATLKDEAVDIDLSAAGALFRRATIDTERRASLRASRSNRPPQFRESVAMLFQGTRLEGFSDLPTAPTPPTPTSVVAAGPSGRVTVSMAPPMPKLQPIVPANSKSRKQDAICEKCDTPIIDDSGVQAFGKFFHSRHLHCEECKEPFKEAFCERNGKAYCQADFTTTFVATCFECRELIYNAKMVQTNHHIFHSEHFRCKECAKEFTDGQEYYTKDGKVYCSDHVVPQAS